MAPTKHESTVMENSDSTAMRRKWRGLNHYERSGRIESISNELSVVRLLDR